MIKSEIIERNSRLLRHSFSDAFKLIQIETQQVYSEAYDTLDADYTYKESEEPLYEEVTE